MAEILGAVLVGNLARVTVDKLAELTSVSKVILKLHSLPEIVREVEKLKNELSSIKVFIEEADRRQTDETQNKWVLDLIDIAHEIEDAVDTFLLECPNAFRGFKILQRVFSKLPFLYKFQDEVKNLQKKLAETKERRDRYTGSNLGEVRFTKQNTPRYELDPNEHFEVVGFRKDIEIVVKNLCDEKRKELSVVSIVGPGGIGKTALARMVCLSKDVKKRFQENIVMVTLSQNYDLRHVLRTIANKFRVQSAKREDMKNLAEKITNNLKHKQYLIVLDDVWTKEPYDYLKKVLPCLKNGSRVLITTRLIADVATKADTSYKPYELNFLNDAESRELFLKHAIPKHLKDPQDSIDRLKDLTNEFIKKCQGWPLALTAVGDFLSTRACKPFTWKNSLRKMSWQDPEIECSKLIATSFEYLPYAKKFCFMYFAALPADHREIEARPLLRMWIAEGLIPPLENKTLEETAEDYLEDLVQRSMVQVSERYPDDSIKYFRVHDILRDIAIQKAKDCNFLEVCKDEDDWKRCSLARRVAIQYSNFNLHASPKLRSLLIFGESELDCSNYRQLRVLATMVKKVGLQSFAVSPNLRYLQLNIKGSSNESDFKKRIKAMKFLETLDIISASQGDLSPWIWQIETLRHVQLPHCPIKRTQGPPASAKLANLQTVKGVISSTTWDISRLPNIPKVRELDIEFDGQCQLDVIAALLEKLNHLVSLSLRTTQDGCELELKDNTLPTNLIELHLEGFKFNSDPIPVLKNLGDLKILTINSSNKSYSSNNASCSFEGFKNLKKLTLDGIVMRRNSLEGTSMDGAKWIKEIQETGPAAASGSGTEKNLNNKKGKELTSNINVFQRIRWSLNPRKKINPK